MILLAAAWSTAHAASVDICLEAQVNYTDLNPSSDYFVDANLDRPLRGVLVELTENFGSGTVLLGRTAVDGANKGCATFDVSVILGNTYNVRTYTDQEVLGAKVKVHNSAPGSIVWNKNLDTNKQFSVGPKDTYTMAPAEPWSILAVTGWALKRSRGGLGSAIDTHFYTPDVGGTLHLPSQCTNECIDDNDIWIGTARSRKAYAVVYSLGYTFFAAQNGAWIDDSLHEPAYNGGAVARLAGLEHHSAAAIAGYAHTYAAVVFNNTSQANCALTAWHDFDWDLMGGACFTQIESPSPGYLSCATGRSPLASATAQRTYYVAMGFSPLGGDDLAASPIDFVRLWWDAISNHGVTFAEITTAYGAAQPETWDTETDADQAAALGAEIVSASSSLTAGEFGALAAKHFNYQ